MRDDGGKEPGLEAAIAALPCWSGHVDIAPLPGGITNRNYRVTDTRGERFVVRFGRDIPEHGVLRFNELAAARAAQAAGLSPEVVHAGDGVLVTRFIDGRTFTPADVREPRHLEPVVALLRRCHYDIPRHFQGPALIFWVFQVIRNYLHLLAERDANPYAVPLESLARQCEHLEQVLGPVTMVFGHNDLLAANLMDDGQRLWLIDWDYAGFNSPLFDLANLASNNEFSPELEARLLAAYFGERLDDHQRRGFAAMQCASLLRETLWSAVSRLTSTIDFDYLAYAHDYYARFERSWRQFKVNHG
jgi:thiamine kinase-like enzyme